MAESNEAPVVLSGLKVLVVDDRETNRIELQELLQVAGCAVTAADSFAAAKEILDEDSVQFGLLVTDFNLAGGPGVSGLTGNDLAMYAKAARPEIRVLLVTGNNQLSRDQVASCDKVFYKPIEVQKLWACAELALTSKLE